MRWRVVVDMQYPFPKILTYSEHVRWVDAFEELRALKRCIKSGAWIEPIRRCA